MTGVKQEWMLWVAVVISIVTYQCYTVIPSFYSNGIERKPFYIGLALFITLLAYFIYVNNYKRYSAIVLFALTVFNLLDELVFNPLDVEQLELAIFISIIVIGHARIKIKQFDKYCA